AAWRPSKVRLFLFDIDGTLVSVRGAGRTAFARALEETYGTAGTIDRYDFRGRTDLRIVHDLMTEAGLDVERIRAGVDDCFQAYVRELTKIIGDGSRVRVLPGVAEVVWGLGAGPGAVVGRLTGNMEAGARVKLGPRRLWPTGPRSAGDGLGVAAPAGGRDLDGRAHVSGPRARARGPARWCRAARRDAPARAAGHVDRDRARRVDRVLQRDLARPARPGAGERGRAAPGAQVHARARRRRGRRSARLRAGA